MANIPPFPTTQDATHLVGEGRTRGLPSKHAAAAALFRQSAVQALLNHGQFPIEGLGTFRLRHAKDATRPSIVVLELSGQAKVALAEAATPTIGGPHAELVHAVIHRTRKYAVYLDGFGWFVRERRMAFEGTASDGSPVHVPARLILVFRAAPELRAAVHRG